MQIESAATFMQVITNAGATVPPDAKITVDVFQALSATQRAVLDDSLRRDVLAGNVKPKDVATRCLEAATAKLAADGARREAQELLPVLASRFAQVIIDNADALVTEAQPHFDEQIAKLNEAARLVPLEADPAWLVDRTGDPAVVNAYTAMRGIRLQLDAVLEFRMALARQFGYGPSESVGAMFVVNPGNSARLAHAGGTLLGRDPLVTTRGRGEAVGGPWQRLLDEGFTLHLNTAVEAANTMAVAQQGDAKTPNHLLSGAM